MNNRYRFRVHDERLVIARLPKDSPLPDWARGRFFNLARTPEELSIVCPQTKVPIDVVHERDKVALGIVGVVPMSTVGVLASLCSALAEAAVPVFVLSTYDTDWLLVSANHFETTKRALEHSGHTVDGTPPAD